ncbi:Phenylalanine--tRNA ligase beta subunit [Mycoplasmopsis californica]|uniref:phenylalanine--tRNA ligase n=1 Tax=Mycoplasmopsis equigenitalium TaxID=114883 RepID=A0ABY5J4C6_9BACT|nr:phenylalanine--tRNA ligase subunit beta [Mycoplasmopsis equigenitalium]UUD36741.1 phenylalanine--tRNA ligase subunit beta [Mycoplasmopsis equigenitalium]VEU69965.1 Phenylalanine--tRNA ligase beta subunit [Mycoplasmopsis californica]
MKFSVNKLKTLLNHNELTATQIANAINKIGFEVEEIIEPIKIKNLKFGQILEISKNPNADKLNVCKVKFNDKIRIIQTNDSSVQVGKNYLAIVDEGYAGNLIIKPTEIKGILSQGMFCSLEEIGFNKDLIGNYKNRIFTLETDIKNDPIKTLNLDDYFIDVSILANRNDANSYTIMAAELSAYFNYKNNLVSQKISSDLPTEKIIDLANKKDIENLVAIRLSNIPALNIQDELLLLKHDFELKNNTENYFNYLSILFGLPITFVNNDHNFRLEKKNDVLSLVSSKNKIVLGANNLNNIENNSALLVAIPSITDARKNLKSAKISNFNSQITIKKVAPGLINLLISKLKNNINAIDIAKLESEETIIKIDNEKLNRYANFDFVKSEAFKDIKNRLKILGFKFQKNFVVVPQNRYDIKNFEDIIEEIFRFYDYDNFEKIKINKIYTEVKQPNVIKDMMVANSFNEILTFTLRSKEEALFDPFDFKNTISLQTYVSENHKYIRNSQLVSLLEVINYNYKRKAAILNFFEIGSINKNKQSLIFSSNQKSFNEMKQIIKNLIGDFNLEKWSDFNYIHTNVGAKIFKNNELVGWIAKINPKYDPTNSIFVELIKLDFSSKHSFQEYNKDPLAYADFTYELNEGESVKEYLNIFKKIDRDLQIAIIDRFAKNNKINTTFRVFGNKETIAAINEKLNK